MRLFIAIEFPVSLRQSIQEYGRTLDKNLPVSRRELRWVNDSQIHLTLKFLGETSNDQLKPLAAALDEIAARCPPFTLKVGGLGHFGNRDRLRVLWLGVKEGSDSAERLAESIESACEGLGIPRENRHFHPHVTLARCKSGNCMTDPSALPEETREQALGSFLVEHLALIRSTLTPDGPRYETLKSFPLKAPR